MVLAFPWSDIGDTVCNCLDKLPAALSIYLMLAKTMGITGLVERIVNAFVTISGTNDIIVFLKPAELSWFWDIVCTEGTKAHIDLICTKAASLSPTYLPQFLHSAIVIARTSDNPSFVEIIVNCFAT